MINEIFWVLITAIFLFEGCLSQTDAVQFFRFPESNYPITFSSYSSSDANNTAEILESIKIGIGIEKSDRTSAQELSVVLDFRSNQVIIPNRKIRQMKDFGIDCSAEWACQVDPSPIFYACDYGESKAECEPALSSLRFEPYEKVSPGEHMTLLFSLVSKNKGWKLGSYGVLGLGPQSQFWDYMSDGFKQLSKGYSLMSFQYIIAGAHSYTTPSRLHLASDYSGYLSFNNQEIEAGTIFESFENKKDENGWFFENLMVSMPSLPGKGFVKTCLAHQRDKYLYVGGWEKDFKPKILRALCGYKDSCNISQSVVGDVENIFVTMVSGVNRENRIKVVLDPMEFIYFDHKGLAQFKIGDQKELKPGECPEGSVNSLGRPFFALATLVIKKHSGGSLELGLFVQNPQEKIFICVALTTLLSIIFIIVVVAAMRTYRKNERLYVEMHYRLIKEGILQREEALVNRNEWARW